jgi:hypothetical protein
MPMMVVSINSFYHWVHLVKGLRINDRETRIASPQRESLIAVKSRRDALSTRFLGRLPFRPA